MPKMANMMNRPNGPGWIDARARLVVRRDYEVTVNDTASRRPGYLTLRASIDRKLKPTRAIISEHDSSWRWMCEAYGEQQLLLVNNCLSDQLRFDKMLQGESKQENVPSGRKQQTDGLWALGDSFSFSSFGRLGDCFVLTCDTSKPGWPPITCHSRGHSVRSTEIIGSYCSKHCGSAGPGEKCDSGRCEFASHRAATSTTLLREAKTGIERQWHLRSKWCEWLRKLGMDYAVFRNPWPWPNASTAEEHYLQLQISGHGRLLLLVLCSTPISEVLEVALLTCRVETEPRQAGAWRRLEIFIRRQTGMARFPVV